MVDHRPLAAAAACSIGDRFVDWQAPAGRPDPHRRPWVSAADRYAIFTIGYPRNPVAPWDNPLRNVRVERSLLDNPQERFNPQGANHNNSRSWMYGSALDPALSEFRIGPRALCAGNLAASSTMVPLVCTRGTTSGWA
jgi:hypothetical protein